MQLNWHSYTYFPYEHELARREIGALSESHRVREHLNGLELDRPLSQAALDRVTFFASVQTANGARETLQSKIEAATRSSAKQRSTRYSAHGLHEYKGKFAPHFARSLLNIFAVAQGERVLDPFCGSGTTLVESAHLGINAVGIDVNPLAVAIVRAKMLALRTPGAALRRFEGAVRKACASRFVRQPREDSERLVYLASWFDRDILARIERLRTAIATAGGDAAPIFEMIASNLLRAYSQQDPRDLRLRRRKTPLPDEPLESAFFSAVETFIERLEASQAIVGTDLPSGMAIEADAAHVGVEETGGLANAAITSPPYGMALPYIDTQRLSLVWLGLARPRELPALDARLTGSRELRGAARKGLLASLEANDAGLPCEQSAFCAFLQGSLADTDGFRRRDVPLLLYRYFTSMLASFRAVRALVVPGARYGLVVGHNHTTLGGVRHEIDTPAHLCSLARASGWRVEEKIPLQAYWSYGYQARNAVAAETLVILRNPPFREEVNP